MFQFVYFLREAFPPLLVNSIVGFTLFSTYTLTESACKYFPREPMSPYAVPFISGAVAGAAQSIISSPLDNVRALLAASSKRTGPREWRGWRHVAFQALFPPWLTDTTSLKMNPVLFLSNWMKSSWTLFFFTLMRDALGFATFFSVFELSRTLAKRAGKAIDRFQAQVSSTTRRIGLDLDAMLENDVLPRGWPGRFVQGIVIVSFGVFAGIGYGIVGRPFDKARSTIWNGLDRWARQKAQAQAEQERQAAKAAATTTEKPVSGHSIKAVASLHSKAAQHAVPSTTSHRKRHSRLSLHESRVPLHPPRPAEPPKHPLKKPSIMRVDPILSSKKVPSALTLLREAYRKEGLLATLGFSSSSSAFLGRIMPSKSVWSRRELVRSRQSNAKAPHAGAGRTSGPLKNSAMTLESLAEHPALGGTSVFDNISDNVEQHGTKQAEGHRKARWWHRAQEIRRASATKQALVQAAQRTTSRMSIAGLFRVVPPYCFGFLVYAIVSGDLSG